MGTYSLKKVSAAFAFVSFVFLLSCNAEEQYPPITFPASTCPMGVYESSAVACDNANCSLVGNMMLQQGGSAVDAAIAAVICNGVVNMHSLGIGGGFFSVNWDSDTGKAVAFDAYGVAPINFINDIYLKNSDLQDLGKYSMLIPGEIAGYEAMHRLYGKVPWRSLFLPTIEMCRRGFNVGDALVDGISFVKSNADLEKFPEMRYLVDFLKDPKTGTWYKKGGLIKCETLADTMELIANNGAEDFYNGRVAEMIRMDLEEFGVPITADDFRSYKVDTERTPAEMKISRGGLTLVTTKPASSGVAAAFVLNILAGYNFTAADSQNPLNYHRYLEALKFAWGQQTFFGDMAFNDEKEMEERIANMTSPAMGEYIRRKIKDDGVLDENQYGSWGDPPIFDDYHSTSHVSVLDSNGNAVSMTSTVNGYFGSLVMGKHTGIIFNNGMSNFYIKKSSKSRPFNLISPGKRPKTTVSPMIFLKDGAEARDAVQLVVGASGSSRILCTVPYVAMRNLWFKESVKQAVDAYRLQQRISPDMLSYEKSWPQWMLDYFSEVGHVNQEALTSRSSISQAIERFPNGTIHAIADYRKGNCGTAGN